MTPHKLGLVRPGWVTVIHGERTVTVDGRRRRVPVVWLGTVADAMTRFPRTASDLLDEGWAP